MCVCDRELDRAGDQVVFLRVLQCCLRKSSAHNAHHHQQQQQKKTCGYQMACYWLRFGFCQSEMFGVRINNAIAEPLGRVGWSVRGQDAHIYLQK